MRTKRLSKSKMRAVAILTLFATLLGPASLFAAEKESLASKNAEKFFLSDVDVKDLAAFKKDCDATKLDLADCNQALADCVLEGAPPSAWWSNPTVIIGGFAVSAGLGVLVAAALSN